MKQLLRQALSNRLHGLRLADALRAAWLAREADRLARRLR